MKKLFFAIAFATFVNASETPSEAVVQSIATPVEAEVTPSTKKTTQAPQELSLEEKKFLQDFINMSACLQLQYITNSDCILSEANKEKAKELFKQCSNSEKFAGFMLSTQVDRLQHKSEAVRKFVDGHLPENKEIAQFFTELEATMKNNPN